MTGPEALAVLEASGDPFRAPELLAYHKADRRYLGTLGPAIDAAVAVWRQSLPLDARVALADALWATDVHEARIAAAKLLTQARMRPDDTVWEVVRAWVPDLDAWAIADQVGPAVGKRLAADPMRLGQAEVWLGSPNHWVRRLALQSTQAFAKSNHPGPAEIEARERVLGWAANLAGDRNWFIQKALADWIAALGKHDTTRAAQFLAEHGAAMKTFARNEAARSLPPSPV